MLYFFVADNQHVGDLFGLGLADFVPDLFVAQIGFNPMPAPPVLLPGSAVSVPVGNGQDLDLDGASHTEGPGKMFDEDAQEAVDGAVDYAMDGNRLVLSPSSPV